MFALIYQFIYILKQLLIHFFLSLFQKPPLRPLLLFLFSPLIPFSQLRTWILLSRCLLPVKKTSRKKDPSSKPEPGIPLYQHPRRAIKELARYYPWEPSTGSQCPASLWPRIPNPSHLGMQYIANAYIYTLPQYYCHSYSQCPTWPSFSFLVCLAFPCSRKCAPSGPMWSSQAKGVSWVPTISRHSHLFKSKFTKPGPKVG